MSPADSDPADSDPANWSLEAKAGQSLLVGFAGTSVTPELRAFLESLRPGGVVYFARNVESPSQVARLSADLRETLGEAGSPPPLVAIDQEGGVVSRLDWADAPGAMAVGATRNSGLAREFGTAVGRELRSLGVTLNLAPVLDVNDEPANPVVGSRSFGEDPGLVADLGTAVARGLREGGVVACGKHFPGHGNTVTDSHLALPRVEREADRLNEVELPPFREAIGAGIGAVMTAHVSYPALDAGTPATVSSEIVTGLLRDRLGFEGVVVTDCMEMDAIAEGIGTAEGAVSAIEAGCDLVTVSHDREVQLAARDAVVEAVRDGRLAETRLDESVRRVLALKRELATEVADDRRTQTAESRRRVARRVAEQSVTVVRDRDGLLPLSESSGEVHLLAPPAVTGSEVETDADRGADTDPRYLTSLRRGLAPEVTPTVTVLGDGADRPALSAGDLAVVCLTGAKSDWKQAIDRLLEGPASVVGLAVRAPYALSELAEASTLMTTYDPNPASLAVAGEVLAGTREARGRLPVSVPLD